MYELVKKTTLYMYSYICDDVRKCVTYGARVPFVYTRVICVVNGSRRRRHMLVTRAILRVRARAKVECILHARIGNTTCRRERIRTHAYNNYKTNSLGRRIFVVPTSQLEIWAIFYVLSCPHRPRSEVIYVPSCNMLH